MASTQQAERPATEQQLNTIPETAAKLRISRDTVYRLIAGGALGSCDVSTPGARRPKTRVSDVHIQAFITARSRTSKGPR